MKNNTKLRLAVIIAFFLFSVIMWCVLWGGARTDAAVYEPSIEGNTLSFGTFVGSSMGYVRDCRTEYKDGGLYLKFYSTFGPNCSVCARDFFEVELPEDCTTVYVYKGAKGYLPVLEKNEETGEWTRNAQ